MALKLSECQEKFMIDTFSIKLTQFEKTGSIGKVYFTGKPRKIQLTLTKKMISLSADLLHKYSRNIYSACLRQYRPIHGTHATHSRP